VARTVPVMATEVPGNFNTAALNNANVKALGDFLTNPPRFKGYATTTQSVGSTTNVTAINLDSELYDSDGGHSTVTSTSRYVVQVAGTYDITGCLAWPSTSGGNRGAGLNINGASPNGSISQLAGFVGNSWSVTVSTTVQCAVGDYIELVGWQTSGGAIATAVTPALGPTLTVTWRSI